eukprot:PhF_6_TR30895/c0_g1_i1/m.45442
MKVLILLVFLGFIASSIRGESISDFMERVQSETVKDECAACTVAAVSVFRLLDRGVDVHDQQYFIARLFDTATKEFIYSEESGHWHPRIKEEHEEHRRPNHRMEKYLNDLIGNGHMLKFLTMKSLAVHGTVEVLHNQLCIITAQHCTPFSGHSVDL